MVEFTLKQRLAIVLKKYHMNQSNPAEIGGFAVLAMIAWSAYDSLRTKLRPPPDEPPRDY